LAYGQTGSGKTYTMGSGFDVEIQQGQVGIIPRAIHHLFDAIHNRINKAQETGVMAPEFKVTAQFMELYNEDVIDLLNPSCSKVSRYGRFCFVCYCMLSCCRIEFLRFTGTHMEASK
jgi:hypothetical protein